jgi:hypothetical protein
MTPQVTDNTLTSSNPNQDDVTIPSWDGEAPVNYPHIRESIALSMYTEGISGDTIATVLQTVDQALVNNEQQLLWENDLPSELKQTLDDNTLQ